MTTTATATDTGRATAATNEVLASPSHPPLQWDGYKILKMAVAHTGATLAIVGSLAGWYPGGVPGQWQWQPLALAYLYVVTLGAIGTCGGVHRLWSHRSFRATWPVRLFLMTLCQINNQGSIRHWARAHRTHHAHSDTPADPHDASRGFWYSHIGCFLVKLPTAVVEAGRKLDLTDLDEDWVVRWDDAVNWQASTFLCFVAPALLGQWLWGSWVEGLLVLGFFRYVATLHNTWLINLVNHSPLLGRRPNDNQTLPTNHPLINALCGGEAEHDYHHAYPWDAAAQESDVGINLTWWFVVALRSMGLVSDTKRAKESARQSTGSVGRAYLQTKKAVAALGQDPYPADSPLWPRLDDAAKQALAPYQNSACTLTSCWYLARDIFILAVTVSTYWQYREDVVWGKLPVPLALTVDCVFAVVAGTVAMGLWVLGHECGHGAFSPYPWVNTVVGFLVHNVLFGVPYHAWANSHAQHHAFNNDMVRGSSHLPPTKRPQGFLAAIHRWTGETGLTAALVSIRALLGWPAITMLNHTGTRVTTEAAYTSPIDKLGSKKARLDKRKPKSLFHPQTQVTFGVSPWALALGTVTSLSLVAVVLYGAVAVPWMGMSRTLVFVVGPYLVACSWLVIYTFLHHTHTDVPFLGPESFTFIRGALSSIDRPYPDLINWLHHDIGSTHVVHHIDKAIPHYHAMDATHALRAALAKEGLIDFYNYDPRPVGRALWETTRDCVWVSSVKGVQFFLSFGQDPKQDNVSMKTGRSKAAAKASSSSSPAGTWAKLGKNVVDIGSLLASGGHPGGKKIIASTLRRATTDPTTGFPDLTTAFNKAHHSSASAKAMVRALPIYDDEQSPPTSPAPLVLPTQKEAQSLLLIDGRVYDLEETGLLESHPGGKAILRSQLAPERTGQVADASWAFHAIHGRSQRPQEWLSRLPSRELTAKEAEANILSPTAGQATWDAAFDRETKRLANLGFFEPSLFHEVWRTVDLLLWWLVGMWALRVALFYDDQDSSASSWWLWLAGGVLALSIFQTRCGWLQHEYFHGSMTSSVGRGWFLGQFWIAMGGGLSGGWWRQSHSRHHTNPQHHGHDSDLRTAPIVVLDDLTADREKERGSCLRRALWRFQAWTFLPRLAVVVPLFSVLIHPSYILRHRLWSDLPFLAARWLMWMVCLTPLLSVGWSGVTRQEWLVAVALHFVVGLIHSGQLMFMFALSHIATPVIAKNDREHWLHRALDHAVDIRSHREFLPASLRWTGPLFDKTVDYWMSYLNYQTIHHLWPTAPQHKHTWPAVHAAVRNLATVSGTSYQVQPIWSSVWLLLAAVNSFDTGQPRAAQPAHEHDA